MTDGARSGQDVAWVRCDATFWRVAPGFLVVADRSGTVTRAEGPAPEIWELLSVPRTVDEIAGLLADRYDARQEEVRADVDRFVSDLAGHGLVDRVASGH